MHFVLSPVLLPSRDNELNDRHLQSHGEIGDCEQSTGKKTVKFSCSDLRVTVSKNL